MLQRLNRQSIIIPVVAVILGLMVGAIFILIGGNNPVTAYIQLAQGIFGGSYMIGETIRQMTPLILTGLAVAFAFRTGLFNIGVEGQLIMGQVAAVVVGITLDLPMILHLPLAVLAAALAGGIWASIPGFLKAKFHVHEVITTIMMNYIALIFSRFLIREYFLVPGEKTADVAQSASLSAHWLSELFGGARTHLGIFIAIAAAILFYYILWRSRLGFELRSVGYNPLASEYAGMSVSKNIVTSMIISGMLAGLAGAGEVLGTFQYLSMSSGFTGYGFDGIAVALIGANTPVGIVLGAFLFGGLQFGSNNLTDVPREVISIIIASVIFFVVSTKGIIEVLKNRKLKRQKGAEQ